MLCRYSIQTRKGEQNIVKPKTPIAVVDPSIAGIFTEVFSLFPLKWRRRRRRRSGRNADQSARERRKSIIIPLGMRTSLVTDNGSGAKEEE